MRHRLLRKKMCSVSRYLFKFWEITDNISEMVKDRYQTAPIPVTLELLQVGRLPQFENV